jgi:hypothetical protein
MAAIGSFTPGQGSALTKKAFEPINFGSFMPNKQPQPFNGGVEGFKAPQQGFSGNMGDTNYEGIRNNMYQSLMQRPAYQLGEKAKVENRDFSQEMQDRGIAYGGEAFQQREKALKDNQAFALNDAQNLAYQQAGQEVDNIIKNDQFNQKLNQDAGIARANMEIAQQGNAINLYGTQGRLDLDSSIADDDRIYKQGLIRQGDDRLRLDTTIAGDDKDYKQGMLKYNNADLDFRRQDANDNRIFESGRDSIRNAAELDLAKYNNTYDWRKTNNQNRFEAKQNQLTRDQQLQIARMNQSRGGRGGGAGPQDFAGMSAIQNIDADLESIIGGAATPPRPNPWVQAATSAANGFSGAVGQRAKAW